MTIAADKGRPLTNKEVPQMERYSKIRGNFGPASSASVLRRSNRIINPGREFIYETLPFKVAPVNRGKLAG